VKPARDDPSFLRAPVGTWVAGDGFLLWCRAPDLCGLVVAGRLVEADAARLVRLFEFDRRLAAPYDAVTDAGRAESADPAAYELLGRYVAARMAEYARTVRKNALIHPSGLPGALVAGFFPLADSRHPWRLFSDGDAAFAWLERPDGDPARAEVAALADQVLGVPALLSRLRRWLDGNLQNATVRAGAAALATSPRSLQRALEEAGATFRGERDHARVRAATSLLVEGDDKLEAIAQRVGCGSASQLVVLFERVVQRSPTQIREAARSRPRR
jgi:AraC-like DNA-binding protein